MIDLLPSILPSLPCRPGRLDRPFPETVRASVRRHLRGQEACRSNPLAGALRDVAGMPGREDRVARDPVPLDREVDTAFRLGSFEQVCPEGVVADERLGERVLMVLGILAEEPDPGVTVERLPGAAECLEPLAGCRVVGHRVTSNRVR